MTLQQYYFGRLKEQRRRNIREALDYGHECVVRQRVKQKAINEDEDPDYALLQREHHLWKVQTIQKALDAQ